MMAEHLNWIRRFGIAGAMVVPLVTGLALAARAQDSDSLYGPNGVSPQAVRQGILGSCYFHASIAALAKVAPETLRSEISQRTSGGYEVHFSEGPEEVVFPEDVAYGRTHSFDRSEGEWVLVLMRSYAQRAVRLSLVNSVRRSTLIPTFAKPVALDWLNQSGLLLVAYDRAIRTVVSQDGFLNKAALEQTLAAQLSNFGVPAVEAHSLVGFLDEKGFFDALALTVEQNGEVFGAYKSMGQGGIPFRVMEAFLGKAKAGPVANRQPLLEQLRRLHEGGMAMAAGTFPIAPTSEFAREDWWVSNHAYTVLDYDEAGETVQLRNPWGSHPAPDGDFKLPLSDFIQAFESYSYAEAPTQ